MPPRFSPLSALNIPPDVSSFYGEDDGTSWPTSNTRLNAEPASNGLLVQVPSAYDDLIARQRAAAMAQANRQLDLIPENNQLEDLRRKEAVQGGFARLEAMGKKRAFQNELDSGSIDPNTPEGISRLLRGGAEGALSGSQMSAYLRARQKPQANAVPSVAKLMSIDPAHPQAFDQWSNVVNTVDPEVFKTPMFRSEADRTRSQILAHQQKVAAATQQAKAAEARARQQMFTPKVRQQLAELGQQQEEALASGPSDESKAAWMAAHLGVADSTKATPAQWAQAWHGARDEPSLKRQQLLSALQRAQQDITPGAVEQPQAAPVAAPTQAAPVLGTTTRGFTIKRNG